MYTFPDPSEFASTVPPVPDVKAWLQEFRTKHQYPNRNDEQKYTNQIQSLTSHNSSIQNQFNELSLNHQTIANEHNSLKQKCGKLSKELLQSNTKLKYFETEYNRLKIENRSHLSEIQRLKQQICENNSENTNTNNANIKWNFDCDKPKNTSENDTNNKNNRKRRRSNSSEHILQQTHTQSTTVQSHLPNTKKKLKIFKPKPKPTKPKSAVIDQSNILEKNLPSNLDLIRGDILAENGSNEQTKYCFTLLSKCTTEEWQLRNFLMEMITGLCIENRYIHYSIVYDHRHCIKKQLTDLRSVIVKSTCQMCIAFSQFCDKSKYGQSLSYFIPIHLQGLYVTIACIREAHGQCMSESIANTQSFKCINPLLKGLTNKHSEVRVKVICLLSSLISQMSGLNNGFNNNKKMEKYADAIGNTIKTYISDANSNVRDSVKKLFENFAKQFPQRAKVLLSKVDINSQKTLRKCIGNNHSKTLYKRQTSTSNYGQVRTRRK